MKFLLTIDTEEDNEWSSPPTNTVENIQWLPPLQALCDRFQFPVTYLTTYGVASDRAAVRCLKPWADAGNAEIGMHLHPWSTPPNPDPIQSAGHFPRPYPSEYDLDQLRAKSKVLTDVIAEQFGQRPVSYRAGRYGFDEAGAKVLLELGYRVDCSVTPGISWRKTKGRVDGEGGPDFTSAPVSPYRLSLDDVTQPGPSQLWEIPVTILTTRPLLARSGPAQRTFDSLSSNPLGQKVARKLGLDRRWCRPYPHYSAQDLIRVYRTAQAIDLPVLEMIFHSSEMMPGASPYRKDQAAVDRLLRDLEELFSVLKRDGVEGRTIAAMADELDDSA